MLKGHREMINLKTEANVFDVRLDQIHDCIRLAIYMAISNGKLYYNRLYGKSVEGFNDGRHCYHIATQTMDMIGLDYETRLDPVSGERIIVWDPRPEGLV